ncbi:precorrin-6A synthase (deacetylating) [Aminobacter aminovorans]|uniref:Precorrin-6A synthase [deacetylating] n=1 Tax=Aminobacter aminovorans TaxID=83263 RepID=A0A380WDC6_AMIAI|nr:precorrin-6A synthase (deacetylating) [Aminobacter aminovorans]TCS25337.1 precorrin-6A synthase (deacetylating) [Aminobacter aminovorans]SUU86987.1 Cobalt-precorrin-2 C(20)-methyltransferase [Aminobacter aminovorans]
MKRKILVIGIGAGNPDYVTIQAVDALNRVNVFFVPDKGIEKDGLARVRREICERFIRDQSYRTVGFDVPRRRPAMEDYGAAVSAWHDAVEDVYQQLLMEELEEDECGAFLVWGDPTLYDSTMRILDRLQAKGGFELEYDVIPGISSVQALAAQHKVALNKIGQSIAITTGRKLTEGFPNNADSVVVMLDGEGAFDRLDGDLDIWWGAYVGTSDEILVSGKLREVVGDIERIRAQARADKGWIMDTYLLKRPD